MVSGAVAIPWPLLVVSVALAVLVWDVAMAGWIAARREAPRVFTQLTVFCGLLVVPVIVITVASGTESGARTISGVTWLVPAVTIAFTLQVLYAVIGRLLSPVVGVPLLLYDGLLAAIALGDYYVTNRGAAPLPLQALVSARDVVVGVGVGRASLVSPLTVLIPMVAPAYPARWRLSGSVRALLVLAATALSTLLLLEWPRGIAAIRSYDVARYQRLQARPAGDFAIGARLWPVLQGPPPARAVRADAAIIEALSPDVVLIVLDDDGLGKTALDSLDRVLEPLRDDSVRIAVALRLGSTPRVARQPVEDEARLQLIARVVTALRPDVLFPALPDPVPSWLDMSAPAAPFLVAPSAASAVRWWQTMLTRSAATVARVRPRTVIGWSAARLDVVDSAVYAWSMMTGSPVGVIGATIYPSFSGLPAVDARLRAFARWHARAVLDAESEGSGPTHWLATVGGLPRAHGDAAQLLAMRYALAWGTQRSWVRAVVLGEPADYDGWMGLRASNGRPRAALAAMGAAARALQEARVPR
jgi:hypothetical protein